MIQLWKCGLVWQVRVKSSQIVTLCSLCSSVRPLGTNLHWSSSLLHLQEESKKRSPQLFLHQFYGHSMVTYSCDHLHVPHSPHQMLSVIQRDAGKLCDNSMDSFWQFVCFHGCLHRYQTNPDVCSQLHNKDKHNLCAGLRCMNRLKYRLLFTNPCSHRTTTTGSCNKSHLARAQALGYLCLTPCVIIWPLSEVMRWIYSENVNIINRLQPYLYAKYLRQKTSMAHTHS